MLHEGREVLKIGGKRLFWYRGGVNRIRKGGELVLNAVLRSVCGLGYYLDRCGLSYTGKELAAADTCGKQGSVVGICGFQCI